MASDDLTAKRAKVVEHAPSWLRQDLASKDAAVRVRAEDTLAAMIAAALRPPAD
ncbi:DUF6771 family protein [Rhizorhabdus wittichii]|uniref:DUF6771 family protein n=1 Tax=Rhizorhabdus wittichii TaxID=160791 RepID=UPI002FF54593